MDERQKTLAKIVSSVADAYADDPNLRALFLILMSPLPYAVGSALHEALMGHIALMQQERLRTFFDELAKGSEVLTEELIQQQDFLHAFFSTAKAAVNTRRKEKIRLFARLLLYGAKEHRLDDERFEEFLRVLDYLSLRELHVLVILRRFEDQNTGVQPKQYWKAFQDEVKTELHMESDELIAVLTRLTGTGLYETQAGLVFDYGGAQGRLTIVFKEFAEWLQIQDKDFANESE